MSIECGLLNCLVVDDEPLALSLLADYISKIPDLRLLEVTSDPIHGLALAKSGRADVVFLDMQMPELNGLQFLKVLQQRTMVIVTTAYPDYALDGYDYHIVDYLLKPVTFERFIISVDKARERQKSSRPESTKLPEPTDEKPYLFIKTDHRLVKLAYNDIHYLEGARDYVVIHTNQGQLLTLESMKSLEGRLPRQLFLRIHKSYIIALDKINFIQRNRVSIAEQLLPVSDSFKEAISKHINNLSSS